MPVLRDPPRLGGPDDGADDTPSLAVQYRQEASKHLSLLLDDEKLPPNEVDEALDALYYALSDNAWHLRAALEDLEKPLAAHWSKLACTPLFKGRLFIGMAWYERGTAYADKVTELEWKGFSENIAIAEKALEEAWALDEKDARIPLEMMTIELAQDQGRPRMELWFLRAMALDPANGKACDRKRNYLELKWHGSAAALLAFGHECVESKVWKGRVPLQLVDVHEALARYLKDPEEKQAYWKRSAVWNDVRRAFERFFELNPDAPDLRQNYVKYAYQCEQWDDLNRQLKLLGEITTTLAAKRPSIRWSSSRKRMPKSDPGQDQPRDRMLRTDRVQTDAGLARADPCHTDQSAQRALRPHPFTPTATGADWIPLGLYSRFDWAGLFLI